MKCPYFGVWEVPVSKAKVEVCIEAEKKYSQAYYSPSMFQVKESCHGERYEKCPFFLTAYMGNSSYSPTPIKRV